ncbi:hypothetical protein MO973_05870 [Paenibacillus sp. TRM 82003]|nr:hypothetical protein [Paenibacillus sp. TRM 82003]
MRGAAKRLNHFAVTTPSARDHGRLLSSARADERGPTAPGTLARTAAQHLTVEGHQRVVR